MPKVWKYQNKPHYYIKALVSRMFVTYQLTSAGEDYLRKELSDEGHEEREDSALESGKKFGHDLLAKMIAKGMAFTQGSGTDSRAEPSDAFTPDEMQARLDRLRENHSATNVPAEPTRLETKPQSASSSSGSDPDRKPPTNQSTVPRYPWSGPLLPFPAGDSLEQEDDPRLWVETRLRITFEGMDQHALDTAAAGLVKALVAAGSVVIGPHPLPTRIERYSVYSSRGCTRYEMRTFKRRMLIHEPQPIIWAIIGATELPGGVIAQIKESARVINSPPDGFSATD